MTDSTILDRLDRQAKERPDRPALLDPRDDRYDAWDTTTWAEYRDKVYRVARAFMALGFAAKDSVGIIGPNRPAWVIADLAAMAAGGKPSGIYATATAEQAEYILADSGASIAVVVDTKQLEKVQSVRARLPKLEAVVLFPGVEKPSGAAGAGAYTWDEMIAHADKVSPDELAVRRKAIDPNETGTLIYTSGTTGPPKGVMLSHHNLTWTAEAANALVDVRPGDRCLSYLPLAHIAEQMMTIHGPITIGATVHFVPVLEHLGAALPQVRPHFMFGVPRVWEKIQAKVASAAAAAPPMKQRLLRAAQKVSFRVMSARYEGKEPPAAAKLLYPLFDRLVYSKFRKKLGLDATRVLVTGAAPLSPASRDWYLSMASPLSEVYGQSEGSGPTTFNTFGSGKVGTAGRPIPGVDVKIAPDGEILVRGKNIFLGYLNQPGASAETLADGWLHSGDVGVLDADGFLKITDRKKDLIITAGGKNIAPQNIENQLRQIPLVSQAVVIGDQRKYLSALLTLKPEALDDLAKSEGITGADAAGLAKDPRVNAAMQREIESRVNAHLAQYETIKKFKILPQELSEANGELTPTMKIKRKVVAEHFAREIEALYLEG